MPQIKRLSELSESQRSQLAPDGQQFGALTYIAPYHRPIEGTLEDGTQVTILATGNVSGMSPAFQVVDEQGRIDWVSSSIVRIQQRGVLPLTSQQRGATTNRKEQTSSIR